ncbi:MAG: transketolase, partial [Acidobacteria bacterium]
MDAIQKANSGHPGAPLGLAPVAWTLFSKVLQHDPEDPSWPDRDRFVLSAGHASMLLYGVLHLTGYDMTIEDIKAFRQWDSRTPGHPEVGHVPGVEMTTGPLGQGCATSVGMALAEAHLAENFNWEGVPVVNHRTWVVCGDGDLMEGVSAEAASLAGHLGLSKLCWIWDNNRITIEGATDLAISDDIEGRFQTYGWHVVRVEDANDLEALAAAFGAAADETERPTLVAVRSHIGFSAPTKQDTAGAHGAPL